METDQLHRPIYISEATYRIQYCLIDSPSCSPGQLLTAGSLLSRPDYQDVIIERSILGLCGSPLCPNNLLADSNRRGKFRISLPEHRVYNLEESYKYCSESCMVRSLATSNSLSKKLLFDMNEEKIEQVLRSFGLLKVEGEELGGGGDLRIESLRIEEKEDAKAWDVCLDVRNGPANTIEEYVP